MKTPKLRDSLHIVIQDLRIGMFIVELDRPWNETPFMLQGFILLEQKDFEIMQMLVKELSIDPRRSDPSSFLHIPWEQLHEVQAQDEDQDQNQVGEDDSFTEENTTTKRRAQNKNGDFLKFLKSLFSSQTATPKSLQFLQYATEKVDISEGDTASSDQSRLDSAASLTKPIIVQRLPSTPQFTAFIQRVYPRDTGFSSLSWLEKWQVWQEHRNNKKYVIRAQLIATQKPKKKKPAYIPDYIPLVTYGEQVSIKSEINQVRSILENADVLIQKISTEFEDTGILDLEQIAPTIQLLSDSVIANPAALMWLIRMRTENKNTVSQALKVAVYMMALGRHIGFNKEQLIELGFIGLLLDVGKLEVPAEILQKTEKLSVEERSIIQRHVQSSIKLLRAAEEMSKNIESGISEHHEMVNGFGYPQGLQGEQISIFGRMAAIADSFTAMTSPRSYSITRSSFDAMKELFRFADTQFHAPLVEEFVQAIGIFPVGSMIELSNGVIAIVLEHNKVRRLEPKVLILTRSDKKLLAKPQLFDLMKQNVFIENKRINIVRGLPDGAYGFSFQDFYKAA